MNRDKKIKFFHSFTAALYRAFVKLLCKNNLPKICYVNEIQNKQKNVCFIQGIKWKKKEYPHSSTRFTYKALYSKLYMIWQVH